MKIKTRHWLTLATLTLAAAVHGPLLAETFPSKPIRMVVPFAPGGPTDQIARALGQRLTDSMGQPVVVDNRPGGVAQIAATAVKQAPADGYTLLIGDVGALALNPALYSSLSYQPLSDFQAISFLISAPMVLMVAEKVPANSVAELVALAKKETKPLTFASQGPGTGGHLEGELFKRATGTNLIHVAYKGGAPAMQDLLAGQVDMLFDVAPVAVVQVPGKKIRVLAVSGSHRSPLLPDVPTFEEAGIKGVDMTVWFGAVVRTGTPDEVIRKLNTETNAAMRSAEVSKRFVDQGFEINALTPEQFGAYMKDETERWAKVVQSTGAKID